MTSSKEESRDFLGNMTIARFISVTKEGMAGRPPPPEVAGNAKQCGCLAAAIVLLIVLAPIVVSSSVVDQSTFFSGSFGSGGYGYGGMGFECGSPGPPLCHLATEVQYWDCGCTVAPAMAAPGGGVDSSAATPAPAGQLRTLGVGGTAPDATASEVIRDWAYRSADTAEPETMASIAGVNILTSVHAMYPWLNPTCRDIGVHSGRDFCRVRLCSRSAPQSRTASPPGKCW